MLTIDSIISTGNEVATLHEATTYFRSEQSGGIEDTLIMSLVQGAREMIEKYIDRSLVAHDIEIFVDQFKGLGHIGGKSKSVCIDLYCAENIIIEAGEFAYINLGVSMKLPEGYKAVS